MSRMHSQSQHPALMERTLRKFLVSCACARTIQILVATCGLGILQHHVYLYVCFSLFGLLQTFCVLKESWNEEDLELDADFPPATDGHEPHAPSQGYDPLVESLTPDEQAVVWWIVVFTCVFQTLHSLSSRAVAWLLQFLGSFFVFLGRHSKVIANIAYVFPSILYQRTQYLKQKLVLPSVHRYVVCPTCLSLYNYKQCLVK